MAKKADGNNQKVAVKILQYFMITVCAAFLIFTVWQATVNYMRTSPIFKVREVVSQQSLQFIRTRTLDRLIGQSIFDIDLAYIQRRLQAEYPQIDHLRIYRQFPNRIYIDAVRRDPFAVVLLKRQQLLVDKDGTVLSFSVPANTKLPLISGLNFEQLPAAGKPVRHPELNLAISIIQAIRDNPKLESMPVVSLDLANLSDIQGVLANKLKIILAEDKVQQKIMMLGIVMSQGKIKLEEVNYIDLRFREPVIGKK
jgi:cell division septal protein FtsQ